MSKTLRRILIFVGLFIISVVIYLLVSEGGTDAEPTYTVLADAELPVVKMQYGGQNINTLYGYVEKVISGQAAESVTPLAADRNLNIRIDTSGQTITGIAYEIRNISGDNLIEQQTLDRWELTGGTVSAVLPIKDLIEKNREYVLKIELTTENRGGIYYYTRIVDTQDYHVDEMMEYAVDFHNSTFDLKEASKYAVNWEPDNTANNDTLAYVNIHSNFNQLTYRSLSPEQVGEADISIMEIDPYFGTFRVRFEIKAETNGQKTTYMCEEDFCIQWSKTRFYLMTYERTMQERFVPSTKTVTPNMLSFGICRDEDIQLVESPDKKHIAFVYGGDLWSYDVNSMTITRIFSYTYGQNLIRRLEKDFGIQISEITDTGDVEFFLYGYAVRGAHEGGNGVSCYKYSAADNSIIERVYIASEQTGDYLKDGLTRLCKKYQGQTYFLVDDTVYTISDDADEVLSMVEGAYSHQLAVDDEQRVMAWTQGDSRTDIMQVRILNMETQENNAINSAPAEYFKIYGFVGEDLVLSLGKNADVTSSGLETLYPQYKLSIVAPDGTEAGKYEKSGIIITRAQVGNGQIIIERMSKDAEGYKNIEDDVLMQNDKKSEKKEKIFSHEKDEYRAQTTYCKIKYAAEVTSYTLGVPDQISYTEEILNGQAAAEQTLYLAYAKGKLQGMYDNAGRAIAAVTDDMGYVVDSMGHRIWHRTAKYSDKNSLIMPAIAISSNAITDCAKTVLLYNGAEDAESVSEDDSPEALFDRYLGGAINLEGVSILQSFMYIKDGRPVIALDAENTPYLIVGYDVYNINIYDTQTQKVYKMGKGDAEALFDAGSRRMLTYVK